MNSKKGVKSAVNKRVDAVNDYSSSDIEVENDFRYHNLVGKDSSNRRAFMENYNQSSLKKSKGIQQSTMSKKPKVTRPDSSFLNEPSTSKSVSKRPSNNYTKEMEPYMSNIKFQCTKIELSRLVFQLKKENEELSLLMKPHVIGVNNLATYLLDIITAFQKNFDMLTALISIPKKSMNLADLSVIANSFFLFLMKCMDMLNNGLTSLNSYTMKLIITRLHLFTNHLQILIRILTTAKLLKYEVQSYFPLQKPSLLTIVEPRRKFKLKHFRHATSRRGFLMKRIYTLPPRPKPWKTRPILPRPSNNSPDNLW